MKVARAVRRVGKRWAARFGRREPQQLHVRTAQLHLGSAHRVPLQGSHSAQPPIKFSAQPPVEISAQCPLTCSWHGLSPPQECIHRGGHLASIHSFEDNERVRRLCAPDECWIGFNDRQVEGTWVWTDGSATDFSTFPGHVAPWNPGEPNGHAGEATDGAYICTPPSHPGHV